MRRFALLTALILVLSACGDDDATTSTALRGDTTVTTVTATSTTEATTTTAPPDDGTGDSGETDCLAIWPEALVQAIAGPEFTFFDANPDRSACTYTALPNGIALAWRIGDRADFDQSKSGTGIGGDVTDVAVCDAGFFTEVEGALLITEAYAASQGRVFTATISGLDLADAQQWAIGLLESAC